MQLVDIKPSYFRCYGDSDWIDLDSELVVLYGPNGFGKTSLIEAVEWLLYGRAKRREQGESLSQRDYYGYYRNVHAPDNATTAVEATIRLSNGDEHTIRRELEMKSYRQEETYTFVDGNLEDLSVIGIPNQDIYDPVIPQHSLQDFIHARPSERRDKISAVLGIEPLIKYTNALEKTRRRFQSSPPRRVLTAQDKLGSMISLMKASSNAEIQNLAGRWESDIFTQDDSEIVQTVVQEYVNTNEDNWNVLQHKLERKREQLARRVFDVSPIQPPVTLQKMRQEIENEIHSLSDSTEKLSRALRGFLQATASQYSRELLEFWKTGLELQEEETSIVCPMCEEETLGADKRQELERRLDQNTVYTSAAQTLKAKSKSTADEVASLSERLTQMFPAFLSAEQRQAMIQLFESPDDYKDFLETHDEVHALVEQIQKELLELEQKTKEIPQTVSDPEQLADVTELNATLLNRVEEAVESVFRASSRYHQVYESFYDRLASRISGAAAIQEIDALLAPIQDWTSVTVVAEYNRLKDECLELRRKLDNHIQSKQEELIRTKGQEVDRWYRIMNPGVEVGYSRMEAGGNNLLLWAETFGQEINAVASLSQCQLNCLGLSLHFMRVLSPNSPFRFLILDDPVQSMDDDHYQTFINDVIDQLIEEHDIQLIICSHVQGLVDDIWNSFFHKDIRQLRISRLEKDGPRVDDAETLENCIARTKQLVDGNEDSRRVAMQVLRRGVEHLIRDVCRYTNAPQQPSRKATLKRDLIPLFEKCPGVEIKHANRIRQTVNFLNPAAHTEVGWSVPKKQQIMPHIQRIEQYGKQFGVL